MKITSEQAERLARYSDERIGEARAVSPDRAARVIVAELAARGYRLRDLDTGVAVYLVESETTRRIPAADLAELVAELLPPTLDAAAELVHDYTPRRRLTDSARLIRARQADGYVRKVTRSAKDYLPELTEDELAASRVVRPERTAEDREQRNALDAARRERERDYVRGILAQWLPRWPTGRHALGDVWNAWRGKVSQLPDVETRRKLGRVGRTAFFAIVSELGDVRSAGARRRVLVIAEQSVSVLTEIRSRLDSGDKLGALRLQRERLAADAEQRPSTPPNPVDDRPDDAPEWVRRYLSANSEGTPE
ncbi:hypothetical protein [Agromyces sp. M3QZ16-3]|uniref:hypothetical protein n=1 Tax=Agromyces sp. M3QZ16-3 TaxID=3447585 RepID=UPI003F693D1F